MNRGANIYHLNWFCIGFALLDWIVHPELEEPNGSAVRCSNTWCKKKKMCRPFWPHFSLLPSIFVYQRAKQEGTVRVFPLIFLHSLSISALVAIWLSVRIVEQCVFLKVEPDVSSKTQGHGWIKLSKKCTSFLSSGSSPERLDKTGVNITAYVLYSCQGADVGKINEDVPLDGEGGRPGTDVTRKKWIGRGY